MSDLQVVDFDEDFLSLSYDWLQNDKELKWLTVTGDFTKDDQQKWFKTIKNSNTYKIYGLLINNEPAGAFGIKNIINNTGEYWGYIALSKYWGKGFGKLLMKEAFEKAIQLGLKSLYLFVRNLSNKRAINLYLSVGFEYVLQEPEFVKMQKEMWPPITKEPENKSLFSSNIYFTKSARVAFSHILKNLFSDSNKKILMPSYIGETDKEGSGVFDPVRENKLSFEFYSVNNDLAANVEEIREKISTGEFGAVLVIHYFGFAQSNIEAIAELCRNFKVVLIEDCAHSMFTHHKGKVIGNFGDFSFFSIHKLIPSIDGGFFRVNNNLLHIPNVVEVEKKISLNTLELYARSEFTDINKKRVENFDHYLEKWKLHDLVTPMYSKLPDSVVPLNFPILIKNGLREKVYFKLIEKEILTCSLYYRLIEEIDKSAFPLSFEISNSILNLPVHQEMDKPAIDYILKNLFVIMEDLSQ